MEEKRNMELKELLTAQKETVEAIKTSVDTIVDGQKSYDERLKAIETLIAQRKSQMGIPGLEDEAKKFSFSKAIYAVKTGDWAKAGFEKEVFEASKQKAMSAGTDTAGGYIVPNEIIPEFIELLRAEAVCMGLGATVLDGLQASPIEIAKQTGATTAYWVGENAQITDSSATVGMIALTPKTVAALVKISNRLIGLSNPSVEGMIRNDFIQQIALAVDLACLRGSGAANEPIGIANTSGINTVAIGTNGGAPTFDYLYDMQYELQLDNAFRGKLGYVMHPATRRRLLKQKIAQYSADTGGEYIIQPAVSDAQLVSWMGFPYKQTTQIPIDLTKGSSTNCTEIYFGNWADLIIAMWGGIQIMPSKEAGDSFAYNQTWIRVIQEVDFGVRHPASFCLINDATIA